MKILYPDFELTENTGEISLFVDSRIEDLERDENSLIFDIILRRPFCYWAKNNNQTFYFGPNWQDNEYKDYFFDDSLSNLMTTPHQIVFDSIRDLQDYWSKYHYDIKAPIELVVNSLMK